ncbi:MAG: family 43 glycosylhydrolase, partial [Lachnospiraceae bacterium]|nr:family 43 glycosylhydrolase [Lachnospiraceae bacterium]
MENRKNGILTKYNTPFIEQRADPFVTAAPDGGYFFLASVPAYDRIVLRYAADLFGLADAPEKTVWTKHDTGIMSRNIWAPELHRIDGRWYIYFAASREDA